MSVRGIWLAGRSEAREGTIEVRNPFDLRLVASCAAGTEADVEAALAAAATTAAAPWPVHERYDVLMRAAARIEARADEYANAIASEGSKTIREARREPPRAANILRLSAEEGRRIEGRTLPFDSRAGSENRVGYYFRFPAGVVAAIMPFNDPLAVFAHKVGPALAAGNAIVVKPAPATPLAALMAAEDLHAAGLAPGRLSVIPGGAELALALARDPRVRVVTFTGGVVAGREIARAAGIKKLLLELGSNSPVIVLADADLERAAPAIVAGAFAQAGENCLGVQRVFVESPAYEALRDRLVASTTALTAGSSLDERTDVCAMIDERQASRVMAWVDEAVAAGARVLTGGTRAGTVVRPTVLEHVPAGTTIDCEEVYGPVVSLYRVASLDEAIARANDGRYGLHAAIFTESLRHAFEAVARLAVGAVIVNDSTDYRLDAMPFGGTGASGIGREGIRFAIEEMTETRVACFNL